MSRSWRLAAVLGCALVGIAASAVRPGVTPATAQVMVQTKDPAHPRVRYADSLLSLNDRCMVRQGTMNPMFKPVYITGRPVGFC